jgi:polysaccharide export outer membrane protein
MKTPRIALVGMAILFLAARALGQVAASSEPGPRTVNCDSQMRSTYLLGPDDELEFSGPELDELAKPMRVDSDGSIHVPLVGRVRVAGLTVQQCERELNKRLSAYIRDPQIAVTIRELRSQPVTVLGAVNSPGVHQVRGNKTLLEMLSLAGGIRLDAGYSIRITRQLEWGCIPLPNAAPDASGKFSVGAVSLKKIMGAENPEENIQILPHDVITVPKAQMVYVIGDVRRSGGFVLGEHESISVLQALALAEGLIGTADTRNARILRVNRDAGQREEIAVDVKGILKGKRSDVALQSDDILFIPGSAGKKAAVRAIEAAIQTVTGLAIWRTGR